MSISCDPTDQPVPDREHVLSEVRSIVVDWVRIAPEEVREKADFVRECHCNSLDMIAMLMGLEDRFSISIPDEIADTLTTVRAMADEVMRCLGQKGQSS